MRAFLEGTAIGKQRRHTSNSNTEWGFAGGNGMRRQCEANPAIFTAPWLGWLRFDLDDKKARIRIMISEVVFRKLIFWNFLNIIKVS